MSSTSERTPENVSSNPSDTSNSQSGRKTRSSNSRNRQRKAAKERNKSNASSTKSKDDTGSKSKSTKSPKSKADSKDFRLLEVAKLIRKHLPITINGYAVTKILESQTTLNPPASNNSETNAKPKSISRKAKEAILVEHIQNVIKRDPQQPIYLSFIMKPADPDFPFELDSLNFSLTVPAEYPKNSKALPSIVVLNTEIPRGFSVNVERGFRTIANLAKNARNSPPDEEEDIVLVDGKGLLSQVQTLNKYLELFLQQEKRQTMKFVTFKNSPKSTALPTPTSTPTPVQKPQEKVDLAAAAFEDESMNVSDATRLKREFYIGEMTQKLGNNVKLFNRSKNEARYKVQIPIVNTQGVPDLWTYGNHNVDIFVTIPNAYPQVPVRAIVASNFSSNLLVAKKNSLVSNGHNLIALVEEARAAEKNFNKNVSNQAAKSESSLVQHLNWLSNQLNVLVRSEKQYKEWVDQMGILEVD